MIKLAREIKKGYLRRVLYLVLFCFSYFALLPRLDAAVVTGKAVTPEAREQEIAKIQSVLERKEVAGRMESMGVSKDEVSRRLAMLSDQDLHKIALQFEKLNPGTDALGFVIGILVIVALVLLILYLTGHLGYSVKVQKKGKGTEQAPGQKKKG